MRRALSLRAATQATLVLLARIHSDPFGKKEEQDDFQREFRGGDDREKNSRWKRPFLSDETAKIALRGVCPAPRWGFAPDFIGKR